jgi:hypothetical protein
MSHFVQNEQLDGSTILHVYRGIDPEKLAIEVGKVMAQRGYELKEGNAVDGVYERGNRVMRLLLGAFHKYFKFGVRMEPAGDGSTVKVRIHKLTSGMSGGLIGVNQVKKEIAGLDEVLRLI